MNKSSHLIDTLHKNSYWPPPIWLMRQAGRYLPEYRSLRKQAGSFLNLVFSPELAAEVTLQPLRRFDFDAAILFSDILVIPFALGQKLEFIEGEGPRLEPLVDERALANLQPQKIEKTLAPIFETVARVSKSLESNKALIGFCGAPWTVATYMLAGRGGDQQQAAKDIIKNKPDFIRRLNDMLVEASISYLNAQLAAGANCIQIFDSWAGALSENEQAFDEFIIAPTARIVKGVREKYPHAPIIGFPRGAGKMLSRYVENADVSAISLDEMQSLSECSGSLKIPFQGNLDPQILLQTKEEIARAVEKIKATVAGKPYIFNLGHGILPSTPIENVEHLVAVLRQV